MHDIFCEVGTEFLHISLMNFMLVKGYIKQVVVFVWMMMRGGQSVSVRRRFLWFMIGTVIPEVEATEFSNYNSVYTTHSGAPKCKL
jgi:hypothetical protein